jgi:hypothetical protein
MIIADLYLARQTNNAERPEQVRNKGCGDNVHYSDRLPRGLAPNLNSGHRLSGTTMSFSCAKFMTLHHEV